MTVRFCVSYFEPPGFTAAHCWYDLCSYLARGIERIGHDCIIVRDAMPEGWTCILVGTCHNERLGEGLLSTATARRPYIYFLTEFIGRSTVPDRQGWSLAIPSCTRAADLLNFRTIHLPLMQRADAVWNAAPSNADALRDLAIDADLLPGGYLPEMEEVRPKRTKDIDFLYYGNDMPHKVDMLRRLQALGGRIVSVGCDVTAIYRNDLIARARVHLAPHRGAGQNALSWARVCYLLNQRSLVVVEQSRDQELYQDCFPWADTDHWGDLCIAKLNRPDRDHAAREYFQRFQQIRFDDHLRPLLAKFAAR